MLVLYWIIPKSNDKSNFRENFLWFFRLLLGPLCLLPPATKLGQCYAFTCVCDSVRRGGLPHCMLGYTDSPQDQRQTPPGTRHNPSAVHAGRDGQQAGGMHPTGMQSCSLVFSLSLPLSLRVNRPIVWSLTARQQWPCSIYSKFSKWLKCPLMQLNMPTTWMQSRKLTVGGNLLPPANEVWGKVIFLHLSLILFTGGVPG